MKTRRHAMAIALSLTFVSAHSQQASNNSGRRIDNARVDIHPVPAPAEVQSDLIWPLPSGVTRADLDSMRRAAANFPAAAPALKKTIDERSSGALFDSGKADLSAEAHRALDALIAEIGGKQGLRIAITGHTDNQRLAPDTRRIFGTNQGLSEARSLAVANYLRQALTLAPSQLAIEGDGDAMPVAENSTPQGMARNRRVELRVWFEAPPAMAPIAPPAPSDKPACAAANGSGATGDVPFRITIDGEPMTTGVDTVEADRQRCTDVALAKADIQVRYDSLAIAPAMNAWATPNAVVAGEKVEFHAWSNYIPWVRKAELRLFRAGQKSQEMPLRVLPVDWNNAVSMTTPSAPGVAQIFYLLRVYDENGRFDETGLKPLTLLARSKPLGDEDKPDREKLIGYGENSLVLRNIAVSGGTVTVNGTRLLPGQKIEALGLDLPVDAQGKFAIKQIMPSGQHSVEVKITNPDGSTLGFRRNLTIPASDWFYIALGDLTVGHNIVTGPASQITGDTTHYEDKSYVDGRGAFYLKGKIKGEYLLTASADTREGPLKDLFSNFATKDPRYLLREINPDLYYPVYGDDSTTVDDAPTQGKFYVRLEKGDSHVMWGNFKTTWTGTELIQYSRGLYGAKLRYRSEDATQFGEKKVQVDGFAADPGTISARDEYRGTGGSLYYLRNLDITQGSERVWVEARDKDSGLVVERHELSPVQDYDINDLQGRITLREPLASTGGGGGLIMTSAISGNALYLVVTYEYAPGVSAVSNFSSGGRVSMWTNDHVQVGVTGYHQGASGAEQTLQGVDTLLRYTPGTYVKLETARSKGVGDGTLASQDGGFGFNARSATGQDANAYSIAAAVDLADVTDHAKGKLSAYSLHRDQGFSAPGQINLNSAAARQDGVKAEVQVASGMTLEAKADRRDADAQNNHSAEFAVRQQLNETWQVAAGIRRDDRNSLIPNASALLSQNGRRTDTQLRFDYKPDRENGLPSEKESWDAYSFVQGTLERDGNRDLNNRAGLGGSWRVNDRVKLLAEGSDGNLGAGGKVGVDYRLSDRSNAYTNYVLESDDPAATWRGSRGNWVSGTTTKLTDQLRTFGEIRASNGAGPQSLTQAFGLDWAPNDRWNYGGKAEFGTVSDPLAGDLTRRAVGVSAGYREGGVKYGGGLEFRRDVSTITGERTTWLVRNSLGIQLTKAWRLLGKLNYSRSDNSQGAFVDGNYHELVTGAAYRPVDNDRWNTLFKYTNLYNVPSPGQIAVSGTAATYAQKSEVFSVDTIYDIQPWLSGGVKYAFRIGQLKDNTAPGSDWFSSRANLLVLRADWHWVKEWDAVLELRKLRATEAADARAGTLVAVYRHLAEGVKVGVGYNFTNYSDDLTNLSYRSRGWFFNMLLTK